MKLASSILVYVCLADDGRDEPGLLDDYIKLSTVDGQLRETLEFEQLCQLIGR